MKAAVIHEKGGPEVLRYEEVPIPSIGAGEVLVRVEAAGVNFAETVRRSGQYYPIPTPLPLILGSEVVGVVEELGPGVEAIRIGSRVAARTVGAYAQYAAVKVSNIYQIPANMDSAAATTLLVQGQTAALVLKQAGVLQAGETVLVHGAAGGVGSLAIQLAKCYGAGLVIGTASSSDKLKLVKDLGADAAIDYTKPEWVSEVNDAAGAAGVNLALEMVGGEIFRKTVGTLSSPGRIVAYGMASHEEPHLEIAPLIGRGISVIGFFLGAFNNRRDLLQSTYQELVDLVVNGRLKPQVGQTFPLSQVAEAHRLLEARQTIGKVVLLPWE